ncbi:MAG: DUF6508 domain-containing protein [Candidatus Cloacimonetes bacterium]|jgi:hypothetical protein|nr:DUF6508 domain-containing protein [Candidatus Cloacimonadota bacterium]MDD4147622.1 DUF6508 domain-containing protein [Candidatus Cloacimonadota bacterium]MDD4560391.1 DUF6508 domain-containing protein [Candidatus Cloacimonadota bacterium]
MHQYDKVLSYIDYFSTGRDEVGTWVYKPQVFPYVNYSPEMSSFIHEVYETDLMDTEYLPYLESHLPRDANLADYIENADFRLLRAIFTVISKESTDIIYCLFHVSLTAVYSIFSSICKVDFCQLQKMSHLYAS